MIAVVYEPKSDFERGKQRIIKTFVKHPVVKLAGYLNYETEEVYCREHDN